MSDQIKIKKGILSFYKECEFLCSISGLENALSVENNKITNCSIPKNPNDVTNKFYVDSHIIDINNPHKVTKEQINLDKVLNIKHIYDSQVSPSTSDDILMGFTRGSKWLDILELKEYVCLDNVEGDAKWKLLNQDNVLSLNTDDLVEGMNNLFFTTVRVTNVIDSLNTDILSEGNKNLYFTDERVCKVIQTKTTDDLIEGKNNLYFTDDRVKSNEDVTLNSFHRLDFNNPHKMTKKQLGLEFVENIKVNFNALFKPTLMDDKYAGYSIGSRWININTQKEYVCLSNEASKAIWIETTKNGEINTGTNLGDGIGIYKENLSTKLQFKSLKEGANISLNNNSENIVINAQNSYSFYLSQVPIDVINDSIKTILYFPWKHSEFNLITNGRVIFDAEVSDSTLYIQVLDDSNNSVLGLHSPITSSGLYMFSIANPSSDTSLQIQVRKSVGNNIPVIKGIILKFDSFK